MKTIDRRTFINRISTQTSKIAAGAAVLSAAQYKRIYGANERIVLSGIGIGGRNTSLLQGFLKWDEIDVKHLCDVNQKRRALHDMAAYIENARDHKPLLTAEMNDVFPDKDVDAVIIATPDHWHGPATIFACQAGKDVYVEKPISHNIWEGRKMVEAARRYKRVVQCGTQNRSAEYNYKALDYIQSGKLGDIHLVKVFNMKPGGPFHKGPDGEIPDGFNYDYWLGPAPSRPYNSSVVGNWKLFWDFTADDLADDGAHQLDLARMLIDRKHPTAVHSSGGRCAFQDDRETPDTLVTTYEYGSDLVMTFELTQWTPYMKKTSSEIRQGDQFPLWFQSATRIEIYGSKGMMFVGRHGGGWQVFTNDGEVAAQEYGRFPDFQHDDPHKQNFIDCIRSRKRPNADVEIGHYSACLIHLSSVSHRVGNEKLRFDPDQERFIDHEKANSLVKRNYRAPYVIPERI
ncbi:MAG: Gfo/Idh/MocA family oxidoreductase [Candidatus Omnitrophica bacterium]|nr:Gfo/Idh/MocA family oxidoreductase [Candidatus Omnitrophota bacterium]